MVSVQHTLPPISGADSADIQRWLDENPLTVPPRTATARLAHNRYIIRYYFRHARCYY